MKKLLLAVVLLVTTMMNAQKGSILVGGNIGYSSEKIGDIKTEGFDFSPKAGYQFTDKWTLGVEGSILNYKESGFESEQAYRVGAFTRYSVPLSDLFSFYTDFGIGYEERTIDKTKGIYSTLTPALFINMKKGFGLNFSIGGINYDNLSGKGVPREERFGFDFGKTFSIGISKNFGI